MMMSEPAVTVRTAADLRRAIHGDAQNIEVREHLDLTTLRPVAVQMPHGVSGLTGHTGNGSGDGHSGDGGDGAADGDGEGGPVVVAGAWADMLLGSTRPGLYSIRANCTAPPSEVLLAAARARSLAPLQPLLPQQCMLLADMSVVGILEDSGVHIWLDGLHLRFARTLRSPAASTLIAIGSVTPHPVRKSSTLWMTGMTLQGDVAADGEPGAAEDSSGSVGGLAHAHVHGGDHMETCKIFAADSAFLNLGGGMTPAVSLENAEVSFDRCVFRDNVAESPMSAVVAAWGSAAVRFRQCLFSGNSGRGQLLLDGTASGAGGVFADSGRCNSLVISPAAAEADTEAAWAARETSLGRITRAAGTECDAPLLNKLGACRPLTPGSYCHAELTAATAMHGGAGMPAVGPGAPSPGGVTMSPGAIASAAVAAVAVLMIAVFVKIGRHMLSTPRHAATKAAAGGIAHAQHGGPSDPPRGAARGCCPITARELAACQADTVHVGMTSKSRSTRRGALIPSHPASDPKYAGKPEAHAAGATLAPSRMRSGLGDGKAAPARDGIQEGLNMMDFLRCRDASKPTASDNAGRTCTSCAGPHNHTNASHTDLSPLAVHTKTDCTESTCISIPHQLGNPTRAHAPPMPPAAAAAAAVPAEGTRPFAAVPQPLAPEIRCISMPAVSCAVLEEAEELHQRLFHPATQLGTLDSAGAFDTVQQSALGAPAARPGEQAAVAEQLDYITAQLDAFGHRAVVLQKYELLGRDERRRGGQAVVQFVRAPQTNDVYAMKLFASRRIFEDERRLYLNSGLASFMPTVVEFVNNEGGAFKDPHGGEMPPLLVMEKGETLTERISRCKHDIFTTIQILGQVGRCLSELHSRGWVHRDLKPGNIMFLPRRGMWMLIDFGLVARAGEAARTGFTLLYAAPEVIAVAKADEAMMTADAAVDAWALGVMAFELLTGRPAFNMFFLDPEEVERQLRGDAELPWEGERLTQDMRRRLGSLKDAVLGMLCREPAARWTCEQFWRALHTVFSGHTTN
eukprot:jgi/Ulvmu1/9721/UM055_0060.1